jgi:hypothetical protein
MTETIIAATEGWRVCVPESNPYGMTRKPFIQIGIIAWAISADGNTVTPITPLGRLDTTDEYVVIGAEPCPFLVVPNGPFVHDYNEMAALFEAVAKRRRAGAA